MKYIVILLLSTLFANATMAKGNSKYTEKQWDCASTSYQSYLVDLTSRREGMESQLLFFQAPGDNHQLVYQINRIDNKIETMEAKKNQVEQAPIDEDELFKLLDIHSYCVKSQ